MGWNCGSPLLTNSFIKQLTKFVKKLKFKKISKLKSICNSKIDLQYVRPIITKLARCSIKLITNLA